MSFLSRKRFSVFVRVLLTAFFVCTVAAVAAFAQTFQYFNTVTTLNSPQGYLPTPSLIKATNGNLYSTTPFGGVYGEGSVYQITPSGQFTTLYSFCASLFCPDGEQPNGVVQGPDGNLYGTTVQGGAQGHGTVFQLTLEGTLTTMYSFCSLGGCADGSSPHAGITVGGDGNYYGTTYTGGTSNQGTFFQLTPSGTLNVIFSFGAFATGGNPTSAVVEDPQGNFWGTTTSQGATYWEYNTSEGFAQGYPCSTGGSRGSSCQPDAFTLGSDGNLYLTTQLGDGANNEGSTCVLNTGDGNCGQILGITPSTGAIFWEYGFYCSGGSIGVSAVCPNGANPMGGVIMGSDGNLYGTTFDGGANTNTLCPTGFQYGFQGGCGTIFVVTPNTQNLTTLYSFCAPSNCSDGFFPSSTLLESSFANGSATLYGVAYTSNQYTLFSLSNFSTTVMVMPVSLSFGYEALFETSNPKTVTLTNTGTGTLNIGTMVPSGGYAVSSTTCGATLSPKGKCTVSVTFTPNALGSEPGTLTLNDSAQAGPQVIALAGTGVTPVTLTPASSNFGKHKVGTTSIPKNFTLKNNLGVTLNNINITSSGPFAVSSTTCGTSLNSKTSCIISVTFSPTQTGTANGLLTVSDSSPNSPQISSLTGTGD